MLCKWIYDRSYIWTVEKDIQFMVDHRSYTHNLSSFEIKAWKKKNSGLKETRTHDICDVGAVLYRLSYQAVLTLWVRNIPVDGAKINHKLTIHVMLL